MEGIRDGQAIDRCFACGLLWPEADDCARCGRRMQWRAAQLVDELTVMIAVGRRVEAWRRAGDVEAIEALCEAVWVAGPEGITALASHGLTVDALRAAFVATV